MKTLKKNIKKTRNRIQALLQFSSYYNNSSLHYRVIYWKAFFSVTNLSRHSIEYNGYNFLIQNYFKLAYWDLRKIYHTMFHFKCCLKNKNLFLFRNDIFFNLWEGVKRWIYLVFLFFLNPFTHRCSLLKSTPTNHVKPHAHLRNIQNNLLRGPKTLDWSR